MADTLRPADVIAAAHAADAALRPVVGRDWSVRAGPLEWDVEQTVTHMIGAAAKYTPYLASRCEHFIGLSIGRWPDATNYEVIDSLVPVAAGLATVAALTPPDVRAYHVTGPSSAADYIGRACVELLVHRRRPHRIRRRLRAASGAVPAVAGLAIPQCGRRRRGVLCGVR